MSSSRKILGSALSVEEAQSHSNGISTNGEPHQSNDDERMRAEDSTNDQDKDEALGISLFPRLSNSTSTARNLHLFSRMIVQRGLPLSVSSSNPRQNSPYEATILRLSTTLAFPSSLSSYPGIFKVVDDANSTNIALKASLSATSTVSTWLQNMADQSRQLLSMDERGYK